MKRLHEEVTQQVLHAISDHAGAITLSPTAVANAVYAFYDTHAGYEEHLAYASLEHLKHIARECLSGRFSHGALAEKGANAQDDMFAELLQDRYPIEVPRGAEPQYKRLECLSEGEVRWNIAKLRRAGAALLKHADALQAWHDSRAAVPA